MTDADTLFMLLFGTTASVIIIVLVTVVIVETREWRNRK